MTNPIGTQNYTHWPHAHWSCVQVKKVQAKKQAKYKLTIKKEG